MDVTWSAPSRSDRCRSALRQPARVTKHQSGAMPEDQLHQALVNLLHTSAPWTASSVREGIFDPPGRACARGPSRQRRCPLSGVGSRKSEGRRCPRSVSASPRVRLRCKRRPVRCSRPLERQRPGWLPRCRAPRRGSRPRSSGPHAAQHLRGRARREDQIERLRGVTRICGAAAPSPCGAPRLGVAGATQRADSPQSGRHKASSVRESRRAGSARLFCPRVGERLERRDVHHLRQPSAASPPRSILDATTSRMERGELPRMSCQSPGGPIRACGPPGERHARCCGFGGARGSGLETSAQWRDETGQRHPEIWRRFTKERHPRDAAMRSTVSPIFVVGVDAPAVTPTVERARLGNHPVTTCSSLAPYGRQRIARSPDRCSSRLLCDRSVLGHDGWRRGGVVCCSSCIPRSRPSASIGSAIELQDRVPDGPAWPSRSCRSAEVVGQRGHPTASPCSAGISAAMRGLPGEHRV